MKENIPGYPGYHITKDGKVYTHKSGVDGIITLSRLNETQKLLGLRISYYNIYNLK